MIISVEPVFTYEMEEINRFHHFLACVLKVFTWEIRYLRYELYFKMTLTLYYTVKMSIDFTVK